MGECLSNTKRERKAYYDIIRLVAIFLVVFNHTPAFHFPFQSAGVGTQMLLMLFVSALTKVAVPLFFMISGALLLSRQESVSNVLCKRVFRFISVIVLFHLCQSVYYVHAVAENGVGVRDFISLCYKGNGFVLTGAGAGAVWFLYAYLGFLFMLPFLRKLVDNMNDKLFFYLFVLQIACGVLFPSLFVVVAGCSPQDARLPQYLPLCSNVFVYIMAGYYVEKRVDVTKLKGKQFGLLFFVSVLFVVMAAVMPEIARVRMQAVHVNQYIPGLTAFLLVPCITLVLIMKRVCSQAHFSPRVENCLKHLGGAVFTVMLVENILRMEISRFFPDYSTLYLPSVWVAGLVWLSGILIGLVLKRIPLINKLV